MSEPLGIGSTVWTFDTNRRVYATDERGGPIFREYFQPLVITGETSKSWLAGPDWSPVKVNKKTLAIKGGFGLAPFVYPSQEAVDDACWTKEYRIDISTAVGRCQDAAVLRQIAAILGLEF